MKKYRVILLKLAREDIKEAKRWYNMQQKGLGKRITQDMNKVLQSISNNPKAFAIRYKDYRLANFKVFPYAAHFTIDEINLTVYITAFMHTSRHPDTAKNRK
jgi:hypothetical protein